MGNRRGNKCSAKSGNLPTQGFSTYTFALFHAGAAPKPSAHQQLEPSFPLRRQSPHLITQRRSSKGPCFCSFPSWQMFSIIHLHMRTHLRGSAHPLALSAASCGNSPSVACGNAHSVLLTSPKTTSKSRKNRVLITSFKTFPGQEVGQPETRALYKACNKREASLLETLKCHPVSQLG